jgi:Secretion system C-terminal sorting domain
VNPTPIISVNNSTICAGETAILTANGATNFTWSNGETSSSISVNPTSTTNFSVIGTSLGCASAAVSAAVSVNPTPMLNLGADIILQAGQNVILNATGINWTYFWSNGAMTSNIVVNSAGIYTVTVTNAAGCTATDTISVTIITATDEQNEAFKISILPNPTHDVLHIIGVGKSTNSVQVLDNLGRVVMADFTVLKDGETRVLNIENLPPAVYFLKIMGDKFTKTVSIVKQ